MYDDAEHVSDSDSDHISDSDPDYDREQQLNEDDWTGELWDELAKNQPEH